jgi:hypothetical protein
MGLEISKCIRQEELGRMTRRGITRYGGSGSSYMYVYALIVAG